MSACKSILLIQLCIEGGVLVRDKVLRSLITRIPQTSAYDLLNFSIVNINTGSKLHGCSLPVFKNLSYIKIAISVLSVNAKFKYKIQ